MLNFIIRYWIEFLFGTVTTCICLACKTLYQRSKFQEEEQRRVKEGILAILHDRLYQACTFYISKEYIDVDSLKNVEYIYNAYHDLGGNGTGTELYNRVKALPIKED